MPLNILHLEHHLLNFDTREWYLKFASYNSEFRHCKYRHLRIYVNGCILLHTLMFYIWQEDLVYPCLYFSFLPFFLKFLLIYHLCINSFIYVLTFIHACMLSYVHGTLHALIRLFPDSCVLLNIRDCMLVHKSFSIHTTLILVVLSLIEL